MSNKPIIAVPSDRRILDPHPSHVAGEKYLKALIDGADAIPIILPSMAEDIDIDDILDRLDAIMLTGSYSNVEPHHYGGKAPLQGGFHDPHRDALTLPLALRALERLDQIVERDAERCHDPRVGLHLVLLDVSANGIDARDPLTFTAAAAVLCAASLTACLVPAFRGARVDPVAALRS